MRSALLTLTALLAAALGGCTSDGYARPVEKTAGVVVAYPPDVVWEETQWVMAYVGSTYKADSATRIARSYQGAGGLVTAKVEPYDRAGTRSILRVSARAGKVDAPEVAERVRMMIQQRLLQR